MDHHRLLLLLFLLLRRRRCVRGCLVTVRTVPDSNVKWCSWSEGPVRGISRAITVTQLKCLKGHTDIACVSAILRLRDSKALSNPSVSNRSLLVFLREPVFDNSLHSVANSEIFLFKLALGRFGCFVRHFPIIASPETVIILTECDSSP